jgi:serpin B
MAYAGSRAETASQLKQLLNLTNLNNQQIFEMNKEYSSDLVSKSACGVSLNLANKLFANQNLNLKQEFADILKKNFDSEIQSLNFAEAPDEAAKAINHFVQTETKEKIKNLVKPSDLNSMTMLVLINAIYFKANWLFKFDECQTYKENFWLSDTNCKQVDMMKLTNKNFALKKNPGGLEATTCELLYEAKTMAMTIILPEKNVNINDIEKKLNEHLLAEIFQETSSPKKVHVYLPKFKLEFKTEVSF